MQKLTHFFLCLQNNCVRLILAGGLKTIFPVFMGKSISSLNAKKRRKDTLQEATLHVLSVLASLCKHLSRGSVELQRLMLKFAEPGKIERLVELRKEFCLSLDARIAELEGEQDEEQEIDEEEEYLARLDGGLEAVQWIDRLAATIHREVVDLRPRLVQTFESTGLNFADVKTVLVEMAMKMADQDELKDLVALADGL